MPQYNTLLIIFLVIFALRTVCQLILNRVNVSHLRKHGDKVPLVFDGAIDGEKLATINAYTADTSAFGIVETLSDQALFLAIVLSGFVPWLSSMISRCELGFLTSGLIFFGVLGLIMSLVEIPFSLYSTFVIENRYGFNTRTPRLWFLDWIKGMALSAVLGGFLLGCLLTLVHYVKTTWWVWAWVVFALFQLLVLWLYPTVIAPLFNKFEPVTKKQLENQIVSLMGKVGLRVSGVYQMDASKRSKHTNAYFTGIGRTKRIVLFDTLLQAHGDREILAILAHEVGHWTKKHVLKTLIVVQAGALIGLYVAARMLKWPLLYGTFGVEEPSVYVGLFFVGVVLSPLMFFLHPLEAALSRKFECEADDAAVHVMGSAGPLRDSLTKLLADNLANIWPHSIYAWFYYSHPPPVERIARLDRVHEAAYENPS